MFHIFERLNIACKYFCFVVSPSLDFFLLENVNNKTCACGVISVEKPVEHLFFLQFVCVTRFILSILIHFSFKWHFEWWCDRGCCFFFSLCTLSFYWFVFHVQIQIAVYARSCHPFCIHDFLWLVFAACLFIFAALLVVYVYVVSSISHYAMCLTLRILFV